MLVTVTIPEGARQCRGLLEQQRDAHRHCVELLELNRPGAGDRRDRPLLVPSATCDRSWSTATARSRQHRPSAAAQDD